MERDWNDKEYANLRALDAEIALTFGGWTITRVYTGEPKTLYSGEAKYDAQMLKYELISEGIPHYTTSVDAALTLIPDGVAYEITSEHGIYVIECRLTSKYAGTIGLGIGYNTMHMGRAERMAYVICLAVMDMHKRNTRKSS